MNICLYGASSTELAQTYYDAAYSLGAVLAQHGHTLIYGGGAQGVMGAAARGAHDHGGRIIGIAPSFFHVNGILYEQCTQFIYTETMQERKKLMMEKSDAFIMAPGGIGTYEEFFEILTLKQLGRINPGIAVLNVNGYYDPMQRFMEHTVQEGFAKPACLEIYKVFTEPGDLVAYLENFDPDAFDVRHLKNL
ncbi:MAG: TIGR00730 family Rossman fold protein [Clostridia bacterium]|nr:TIGR00730 family Rossman fold protein [Clostridia bacterium]